MNSNSQSSRNTKVESELNSPPSDADIARLVQCALESEGLVAKGMINISVDGGWITLSGELEQDYQRAAAESAVRDLIGVKGVTNNVSVKPCTTAVDVKARIDAVLKRRTHVDANNISVAVRGTNVILTGTVHTLLERDLVTDTARLSYGVRHVIDNMIIV